MIIILLLCLCFTLQNFQVDGRIPNSSKYGYLDLEERLKVINKPPVKSIQTEFGHIVDCIDIKKQLAFDNPLLRNHKIQLKPSFQDTTTGPMVKDTIFPTLGKNLCPKGTVPVQRTTKEDLIRENLFSNNVGNLNQDTPGVHFAGVRLNLNQQKVYVGSINGTISVYNPTVAKGQMSSAYIWLSNGTDVDNENNIQAGWQVNPTLFGDDRARFYASWSNGMEKTGCTNIQCPGFVQTSYDIYLGTNFANTSIYGGLIFSMRIALTQDPTSKNWWLITQNTPVGYFPALLFSNNFLSANEGGWTGKTVSGNLPSPPMGSGHLPDGNYGHSAYIGRISIQDQTGDDIRPIMSLRVLDADSPQCYNVTWDNYDDEYGLQHVLEFGGPGGNC